MSNTFTISQSPASETVIIYPNAVGSNTGLSPVPTDKDNYECIDDTNILPDDDNTYVYNSSTDTLYDLYNLPNQSITGEINYVNIVARAKAYYMPPHEDSVYKIIYTDNNETNTYKTDNIFLTTSYKTYSHLLIENPRTASAWTWDDVNNLQIGIECESPIVTKTIYTVLRPTSTISAFNTISVGDNANHLCIDDSTSDEDTTYVQGGPTQGTPLLDWSHGFASTYGMSNMLSIPYSYSINKLYIYHRSRRSNTKSGNATAARIWVSGSSANGTIRTLSSSYNTWVDSFSTSPNTSVAFTEADINNLIVETRYWQVGLHNLRVTQMYGLVELAVTDSPEIRTTQMYMVINYTPPSTTLNVSIPEEISCSHASNINMLNFWKGTREVYSMSRSHKTLVLRGTDYSDTAVTTMNSIRDMGRNGADVTISGLNMYIFNDTFKIRSFGCKEISKNPLYFEWILELEYSD